MGAGNDGHLKDTKIVIESTPALSKGTKVPSYKLPTSVNKGFYNQKGHG